MSVTSCRRADFVECMCRYSKMLSHLSRLYCTLCPAAAQSFTLFDHIIFYLVRSVLIGCVH
jgi:hypothetical protein